MTGPPQLILNNGSMNSFSLLAPEINKAEVTLLTHNVTLSTELVGRWQKPDYSFVTDNYLTFSIFHQFNEGLYKFYVTDLNGEQALAIQINISITGW